MPPSQNRRSIDGILAPSKPVVLPNLQPRPYVKAIPKVSAPLPPPPAPPTEQIQKPVPVRIEPKKQSRAIKRHLLHPTLLPVLQRTLIAVLSALFIAFFMPQTIALQALCIAYVVVALLFRVPTRITFSFALAALVITMALQAAGLEGASSQSAVASFLLLCGGTLALFFEKPHHEDAKL